MRGWMLAATAVVCLGCGGNDDNNEGAPDLATATGADLGMPADLAQPGAVDLAFGSDTDGSVACTPAAGATAARYVWNAMTVPLTASDFAYDLNGDGRADNQLGNIAGALAGQGFDLQAGIDGAITGGQSITLVDEQSTDPTFGSDACAATDVVPGVAMAAPDFSGNGRFTIDGTVAPGHFFGPIASGAFVSQPPPAQARVPVVVHKLMLPLFGVTPVDVYGARIQYVRAASGQLGGGQLNGAIRQEDIQTKVVPAVAALFNQKVTADPTSSGSMQLLSIFDNGGTANAACGATCKNLDGSCAAAGDGQISDCEVGTNGIIKNVLAPDVQMFDAAGNYHPNPLNTKKDSLSVGVGFTAVPALF